MDPEIATAPADTLSVDDFIRQGNAHERGLPAEPVVEAPVADAKSVDGEDAAPDAAAERNTDGTFKAKAAKPRNDPQARIDQAIGKQREAERRAAELEAKLAERERAAAAPVARVAAPVTDAEPNPEDVAKYPDGQYDRKFLKDQARWEARQEFQAQQRDADQARQAEATARARFEREGGMNERIAAAHAADPSAFDDIDPRLLSTMRYSYLPADQKANATLGNHLMEEFFRLAPEHPVELLKHLSTLLADRKEIQRLATLPPEDIFRQLAILDARFGAASPRGPVPTAPISQAKAPIKPLGSTPHAADPSDVSDDLSVDEHIKRMNARDQKAWRARQ